MLHETCFFLAMQLLLLWRILHIQRPRGKSEEIILRCAAICSFWISNIMYVHNRMCPHIHIADVLQHLSRLFLKPPAPENVINWTFFYPFFAKAVRQNTLEWGNCTEPYRLRDPSPPPHRAAKWRQTAHICSSLFPVNRPQKHRKAAHLCPHNHL